MANYWTKQLVPLANEKTDARCRVPLAEYSESPISIFATPQSAESLIEFFPISYFSFLCLSFCFLGISICLCFFHVLYLYFLQGTCLYLYSALLPNGIRLWMKEKLSRWQCLHKHGLKVTVIKMFAMKLCLLFLKPSEWVMKIIQSIRVVKTSKLYF